MTTPDRSQVFRWSYPNNKYSLILSDFLTVLDADGRLTLVEDRLVVSEITMVTRLIQVYKALGGGWERFEGKEKKG